MSSKIICALLLTLVYCTASSQAIPRKIIDSSITKDQFYQPQKAVYAPADRIITAGLAGTWKDQVSVLNFKKNGQYSFSWSNGQTESGIWKVNNRVLELTASVEDEDGFITGTASQSFFIIAFDGKKIEYQSVSNAKDQTIWIAVKQSPQ